MSNSIPLAQKLFQIKDIYYEPEALKYPRAQEVLSKFSNARLHPVKSHWNIPEVHKNPDNVADWNKVKRTVLILGTKKKLECRENGRSSDFIAPSQASGCTSACVYCFTARRKSFANPVTTFVNIEEIISTTKKHIQSLGAKTISNQTDPKYWVYDIGENNDCSIDAEISDNVKDLIDFFSNSQFAKASFATKTVNYNLLSYTPKGRTRIRFSLMPQLISSQVDIRTSSISDRIQAVNKFVEAGYEVHLNFSPVILVPKYLDLYKDLLEEIDDVLALKSKEQLKCEIIFLTHNEQLHHINMQWNPKAEELLWVPKIQEPKTSQTGGANVRYQWQLKARQLDLFKQLLLKQLPYCQVRYAF
jgi:spore photoproduct lyase family protein